MLLIKVYLRIRCFILKVLFKLLFWKRIHFGTRFNFRRYFLVNIGPRGKLTIGNNVFFNNFCSVTCLKQIVIGNNCLFGEGVKIYDHNHFFDSHGVQGHNYRCDDIYIGNNCWICSNVVILKGTHIGDNCIIGAGCIVSGNISPNTILKNNWDFKMEKLKND